MRIIKNNKNNDYNNNIKNKGNYINNKIEI